MKTITEADLIDYLAGELPPERYRQVKSALLTDSRLEEELEILRLLREDLCQPEDVAPSPAADRRFAELLATQPEPSAVRRTLHPRAAALIGVAASLLLVFGLGWYSGRSDTTQLESQLAATRTLMLELMQDENSTTRMQAATISLEVAVADPAVIANLGRMLRTDDNTNVRLAALDALQRFADDPAARQEMLDAMAGSPPPGVQAQLMETLVHLGERRVLPYLEDLIQNDSIPRPLRDAAELGTFKLI
ncbi:HEAT repeat domain-containing protein [Lewinella sp. IMCC34183]|uniref:HEAT repeat domain-containing protein n=1 Tax=Lewinella sp. IMCC34183 TaxID=2248762 RepID=UPI000E24C442|nr:HEAT repeat domain-containing protein [Lewinella sp. IMCC34183]